MDDFLAHWRLVESRPGPSAPLSVLDDFGIGDLIALRESLAAEPVDVTTAATEERLAAAAVKPLHAALRAGMKRFNLWVRGDFPETKWARLLARIPPPLAGPGRFLPAMRRTLLLWERLETDEPGAVFPQMFGMPPYARTHFAAELARFAAAWEAHGFAELDLRLARAGRQMIEERAVAVMKAYGHAVKARLGDGSRLAASLPQLWPGLSGRRAAGSADP